MSDNFCVGKPGWTIEVWLFLCADTGICSPLMKMEKLAQWTSASGGHGSVGASSVLVAFFLVAFGPILTLSLEFAAGVDFELEQAGSRRAGVKFSSCENEDSKQEQHVIAGGPS